MAKFWNHLKYHEDMTEKRRLTAGEIAFLRSLQTELNTQDHCETRGPRYWVIRDYKRIYGEKLNNPDGVCLIDEDGSTFYEGEDDTSAIIKAISKEFDLTEEDLESLDYCFDFEDMAEYLGGEKSLNIQFLMYQEVEVYSGSFLTQKAAEVYLRSNAHHHDERATTYCMHNWRNPEAEMLLKILEEVDLSNLGGDIHD